MYWEKVKSVYVVDWQKKYDEGYRGIMFDIDNTLVPNNAPANEQAINLFRELHQIGFKTLLLSNNSSEERVKSFAEAVGATWWQEASAKPFKVGYKMGLKLLDIPKEKALFCGDQLFTDFIGGVRVNIYTILTSPLDKKSDGLLGKMKRIPEKPIRGAMNIYNKSKKRSK